MAIPTRTEEIIQRVVSRGEAWLQRIDQLLEDPDRFEDEFSGATTNTEEPEVEDEAEGDHP